MDCLPVPPDGSTKRLLPKQQDFFNSVLDLKGPKFVLYAGGVGSAKTTIGCLTTIALACAYPGDYLVCRQFQPELKITTLKTFLDLCPKSLILEHRVADGIIRIRCANGKHSNVIFRGLDDPDKHRSLNLNAAYIDESSQVSEEAFLLLQSRLRGAHVCKIYMTTNPAGHDWQYRYFVKQDMFTTEKAKNQFKLIKAPSTENVFLRDGYVESMMSTYSQERIDREIMASFDAFEGQVYPEFRRDIHVIKPFKIPSHWPRYIGIDHGYRNPAAWVWGAVDGDGTMYIYREFYEPEWLIEEICRGNIKKNQPGVMQMMKGERIELAVIDPSTRAERNERLGEKISDFVIYQENLPADFPLVLANNDVTPGIDRVKSYLKLDDKRNLPSVYIFDSCTNLIDELLKYRYQELRASAGGKQNEKETPYKVDDHACDAFRYLLMSQPESAKDADAKKSKVKYNTLEGSLMRDLEKIRKPGQSHDPFGL